ncbi:PAS domain S-box protein [Desulfovibrio sp. TomC]|uniref:PAS domain S-box protein n=1 Tax=Desulfovibrio sp. TomC TaxID=1562888 RepID=UPI0005754486|nr:PAS domain S-box protein [Desulfovibrio sp. TomC]KHK01813.1 diguanylate cyclase/phosphodiesterase (GGDEF & EAL domains) with PAS/PAC sensor(s) [Desulfovibrio sp. TomC]
MATHPFGERIRSRRLARLAEDNTFTLRRLAGRLGIQPSYLSRLERGAPPSLSEDHIQALARELGDDADALLALAGKIPGDVRRLLLDSPERLAQVRALAKPCALGPQADNTPPRFWQSYRESQRLARVGSFVRDLVANEDFWSEEFFRIFGLPPGSPTPDFDQFLALVHPEDQPAVLGVRARLAAGGEPVHYTYRFRHSDGCWRHAKAVARCEYDASGRVWRIHGTVQDVTTERQALLDLRSVAQFPEDNPHPVLRVGKDGRLAYANQASAALLNAAGLAVGESVGSLLLAEVQAALDSAAPRVFELPVAEAVLRITAVPLPAQGQVNLYGCDVTGERTAQAALEAVRRECSATNASMLQAVLDASLDAITFVSAEGRILRANSAMARAMGPPYDSDPALLVGLRRNDVFAPDTALAVERDDQAVMTQAVPLLATRPMAIVTRDGITRRLLLSRSPLHDANGNVIGFCAVGRDVTDWHDTAKALAASEARYQRLIDDAVLGVFRTTVDGRILAANPAMARMLGYDTPKELIEHIGHNVALGFEAPQRRQEIVERLADGHGLLNFDNTYVCKDGTRIIGRLHARLATDENGERVVEGFVEDITERKRVEAELVASEERLKTHLQNFPLPSFTFALEDRQLILTNANKAAEALFRGRIGASLGASAEAMFEEAPDVYLALWNAFESRRTDRRRLSLRPPGACEVGLFDMTFVFVSPDTVILHAEEITAMARMRENLHRTSEQLRSILDHVPCAIYFKDTAGHCIMINRAVEEAFGRPAAGVVGQAPGSIHEPEVAARIAEDDRRVLESGRADTFEEDVLAKGQVRRFLTTKVPLKDERGEPYAICGMSLDITDHNNLEQAIKNERDTLKAILAHVPYAALLASADGGVVFLNQYFIDLVGYTLEDIPDLAAWLPKAYPDESLRARVAADWLTVQGRNCHRIYPVRCGDGRSRWIEFKSVALGDGRMLLTLCEADPRPLPGWARQPEADA